MSIDDATRELLATARALAAHDRFEWHEGMLAWPKSKASACGPYRIVEVRPLEFLGLLPDLEDDATAGVLLAMLAEEWPDLALDTCDGEWTVSSKLAGMLTVDDHIGVAVARALLASWDTPGR